MYRSIQCHLIVDYTVASAIMYLIGFEVIII